MRSFATAASLLFSASVVSGDVKADLVPQLPFFPASPFKVYSGYLEVPGPVAGYDKLMIHYQFDVCQKSDPNSPVVSWHTGGPGGSSLYGQYAEMGYFQVDSQGTYTNEYAWNRLVNMLYLESPAGSFLSPTNRQSGFSYCEKNGKIEKTCKWNDTSQAEAYGHTLIAFFNAFPEYKNRDFYLTGESYAGQYVPNIANYLLTADITKDINLKGIAVGNGCWGGDATSVKCNGPNTEQNDVDFYYGKGLVSKKMYNKAYSSCKFNTKYSPSVLCDAALAELHEQVGPHNVYNVYDNCPGVAKDFSGKQMLELKRQLRDGNVTVEGGYDWTCGQFSAVPNYMLRPDVRKALHLEQVYPSGFSYTQSGPASITLYPKLASKIRVLIYNGDADTCVPYNGNEEWTTGLAKAGVLTKKQDWHPWMQAGSTIPTGYATTYTSTETPENDFSFVTVRLAGHEVPNYRPKASFYMFEKFITKKGF